VSNGTTPRPWAIQEETYGPIRVLDANGNRACEISCSMALTAHDIVRAVNSHDDLVKAVEMLLQWKPQRAEYDHQPKERGDRDFKEAMAEFDFARSALEKAKAT
jgi:hypothetical protein